MGNDEHKTEEAVYLTYWNKKKSKSTKNFQ